MLDYVRKRFAVDIGRNEIQGFNTGSKNLTMSMIELATGGRAQKNCCSVVAREGREEKDLEQTMLSSIRGRGFSTEPMRRRLLFQKRGSGKLFTYKGLSEPEYGW